MSLTSGKQTAKEINEVRCSVVEDQVSKQRADFIQKILEFNDYTVQVEQVDPAKVKSPRIAAQKAATADADVETTIDEETKPEPVYTVGVTDVTFNIVVSLYARTLKTPEGQVLSAYYWRHNGAAEPAEWYWDIPKSQN